jgi:hypothetical protein
MRRERSLPRAWPDCVLARQSPDWPCVVRRSAWSPSRAESANNRRKPARLYRVLTSRSGNHSPAVAGRHVYARVDMSDSMGKACSRKRKHGTHPLSKLLVKTHKECKRPGWPGQVKAKEMNDDMDMIAASGYETCFGPTQLTQNGLPVPVEQALSLRTDGEIRGRSNGLIEGNRAARVRADDKQKMTDNDGLQNDRWQ